MAQSIDFRQLHLSVIHDGQEPGPPLGEALEFGMPDRAATLHRGIVQQDGFVRFDLVLDIKNDPGAGAPALIGSMVHGSPASRFLYLGWKRGIPGDAPWGWRIKIPLRDIGWPLIVESHDKNLPVVTDMTGRRPHETRPVIWAIAA